MQLGGCGAVRVYAVPHGVQAECTGAQLQRQVRMWLTEQCSFVRRVSLEIPAHEEHRVFFWFYVAHI